MGAIENALARANADQRDRALSTIEEARSSLQSAQVKMGYNPTGDTAAEIAKQEQIIAEAQRNIPAETMKSVDEISAPMNTPPVHGQVNTTAIDLNPNFKTDIQSVEQSGGNNYLNQTAMDRAMSRETNDNIQQEPQQMAMGR